MSTNRMRRFAQSIERMGPTDTVSFITDCLLLHDVDADRHHRTLRVGLGWFQPNEGGCKGRVSSPFPILVSLMEHCNDGKFSAIGAALNPRGAGFSPTKAMEYISALAVLLHCTKSINLWASCPTSDAFELVNDADDDFFTVWKMDNQAVLDFGGKIDGWKILGQSKMQLQQAGTSTTQALIEVLEAAWKIGARVKKGELTGKLHAYWVSSRDAQKLETLRKLIHSFRVAMMGEMSKEEVLQNVKMEKKQRGTADPTVYVSDLMNYLVKQATGSDYMFTYVGRIPGSGSGSTKHAKTSNDSSIIHLEDILPKGVFAGWG
jgi:hypothetical protein